MQTTTIRLERPEGTTIATGLPAAIEASDLTTHEDEGGERDYLAITIYVLTIPTVGVRRRDVLVDERATDPSTGQLARYRVVAVEQFERDYIEAACQQIVGN